MRPPSSVRNAVILIALSVIAVGSWYFASSLQSPEITRTFSSSESDGFYLRSARILGTDVEGKLLYSIEAEFAQQNENKDIELQNVQIRYSAGAEVPWTINADTATLFDEESMLRLSGHVTAVSSEGFEGEVTEIRAPQLDIDPDSYRAETDTRVQIRIGSRSLTATGMLALLKDNRLQLKSNVSGKFVR
ncbi:MAG: lipopolysaccharide export system protein LptC [Woeseiaceae bacterium]